MPVAEHLEIEQFLAHPAIPPIFLPVAESWASKTHPLNVQFSAKAATPPVIPASVLLMLSLLNAALTL